MTTESVLQPGTSAKNVLIIRLGAEDQSIIVEDENGKGGGNVLSSDGRRVTWINATGFVCELKFRRLLSDDSSGYGGPEWPFTGTAPGGCVVRIPDTPGGRLSWGGTLRPRSDSNYFKYDVVLSATDGRTPPPPLDPIIIIER